jgi:hypothetical protein
MCTDIIYSGDDEFMGMFTETQNPNYLTEEGMTPLHEKRKHVEIFHECLRLQHNPI